MAPCAAALPGEADLQKDAQHLPEERSLLDALKTAPADQLEVLKMPAIER